MFHWRRLPAFEPGLFLQRSKHFSSNFDSEPEDLDEGDDADADADAQEAADVGEEVDPGLRVVAAEHEDGGRIEENLKQF